MKKTLLLAGIAGLLSFNANAQYYQQPTYYQQPVQPRYQTQQPQYYNQQSQTSDWRIRPVLGADYSYSMFSLSDDEGYNMIAADDIHSFALSGGLKFNQHFGIEAFYQNTLVKAEHDLTGVESEFNAYGLDLVGYLPVSEKFDLIGTAGVAKYEVELSYAGESLTDDGIGGRIGFGGQYNFNNNISARFMARYNHIDIEGVDNMIDLTAGFRFYFL